jgi:hypothetical protein
MIQGRTAGCMPAVFVLLPKIITKATQPQQHAIYKKMHPL